MTAAQGVPGPSTRALRAKLVGTGPKFNVFLFSFRNVIYYYLPCEQTAGRNEPRKRVRDFFARQSSTKLLFIII